MAEKNVTVELPEKLIPYIVYLSDGCSLEESITNSLVLSMFVSHTVTLEKAAELSGMSIWKFIDYLNLHKIPWGEYSEEALEHDLLALEKMERES